MIMYTAISRKVVGKSARDNCERYCGWFWAHCWSKKFERRAGEAMDICLWVLKESNKSWFDGYCVRNSVLIISHVTFGDCRVHIVSDNLSRNSCSWQKLYTWVLCFLGDWKTMLKIESNLRLAATLRDTGNWLLNGGWPLSRCSS